MLQLTILLHLVQELSLCELHFAEGANLHPEQEGHREDGPNQGHQVRVNQEGLIVGSVLRRILDPAKQDDNFAAVGAEKYEELQLDQTRFFFCLI